MRFLLSIDLSPVCSVNKFQEARKKQIVKVIVNESKFSVNTLIRVSTERTKNDYLMSYFPMRTYDVFRFKLKGPLSRVQNLFHIYSVASTSISKSTRNRV